VNLIAKSLSSISWSTYETRADGSEYALENHPILQLLQIPYPNVSGAFFLESVFSQLMLSGNAYIRIGTREAGQKSAESAAIYTRPQKELVAGAMQHAGFPQSCKLCGMQRRRRAVQAVPLKPSTEATNQQTFCGRVYLQCLRSDKVCVLIDENGTHVGFQYKDGSAEKFFPIDPSGMCDILHLKTFNPLSDWYGMSPIEAASRSIDQHNAVGEHNLSILQNGGRPSGALLIKPPKNGLTLTQEQRESLRDDLCSMYQGVENAGRLAVIEGECEWKEMGLSPKDLDFNKGKNMSAREIAQAFGVPPILLGMTEDATFSNYKEARINFWEDTLLPLLNHLISELNMWLVPRFCQNLRLDYDKDNIPALAARRDYVWAKMQESAFLTINEKRQALGYCPVAGGDTIV
jgi:HK97 family phage portal protein